MMNLFDLEVVPFSYFQSWMSISIPRNEQDLFLRNCHNGPHNIFSIELLLDNEPVKPEIIAGPWSILLRHADASVEICFESATTIRMRGKAASLKLGKRNLIYSEAPNRAVINDRDALRRYQIDVLHGAIEVRSLNPNQLLFPKTAIVMPADDGWFELAIDEFWSTWQASERASFDECLAAAESSFSHFRDSMPAARTQDESARTMASYINWSCTVGPCGLIKRPTIFMSKNWMCNVWSWDQCFNAMAVAKGQPSLAMDQMLTLVDHQDAFGVYPDSINDITIHFNFAKPPVHGWTFGELLKRMPERPSDERMRIMYHSLSRQVEWWMKHRRKEGARLPYYLHGNDSGWDNSTMFRRGVPLIAPDLAAFLILQMAELSGLAAGLGAAEAALDWGKRADALQDALLEELWRGDHFVACLAMDGSDVECRSLIPFLPIILGKRLPEEVCKQLKNGIAEHLTEWGLATEHLDSPAYKPNGYWQGPIWAPSTYIAVVGLDRCGFTDLADDVAERFCRLCDRNGFGENFDARTGVALCDRGYTWTASVFLLLAERMKERKERMQGQDAAG